MEAITEHKNDGACKAEEAPSGDSSVAKPRSLRLWNKVASSPLPCEAEFETFESHFIRHHHQQAEAGSEPQSGLLPNQIISDCDYWGDEKIALVLSKAAAHIADGTLTVGVPEEWERCITILSCAPIYHLSHRMMDRVEIEQVEYRNAMSVFQHNACKEINNNENESNVDLELQSVLLEYMVAQRDYITELRQARREMEHLRKQANTVLEKLYKHRQSTFGDEVEF